MRCACSRRAHENAARGHIAFSHFGDAAAILSARGLVHKRWHASISQGSCICTSYTFKVYALAITLLRHAHAHMHALHNVHMRVPYGTESLPKTRASLMQHCMVAASRVDPWPKSWCSAQQQTARCIHTYPPPTGDRYHVHVSKVEFLRAAGENFGNWEVKRSSFSEKMAIRTT